jgi:hypothetical protein
MRSVRLPEDPRPGAEAGARHWPAAGLSAPRLAGLAIVWLCVVAALAVVFTPLLLALLMVLFDSTAHGLMQLVSWLLSGIDAYMPVSPGSLPDYQALRFSPWAIIAGALLRGVPCLLGLAVIAPRPRPGRHWLLAAASWGVCAVISGGGTAVLLLPPCVVALVFARPKPAAAHR